MVEVVMAEAEADGDGLEPTMFRFIRSLYLRLLSYGTLHTVGMSEEQEAAMLEQHHAAMEADTRLLMTFVERGQVEAAEAWRAKIHAAEGVDHEMLDEAIDYALTTSTSERE